MNSINIHCVPLTTSEKLQIAHVHVVTELFDNAVNFEADTSAQCNKVLVTEFVVSATQCDKSHRLKVMTIFKKNLHC